MAWYSAGTVSVTNGSPTITGTGTAFFAALQSGWGFIGPDNRAYEILSVNSDTSLTLATNYQSATAAGQSHACWPTMSLATNLTATLESLIAQYQGVVDGVGAGKFPDGSLAVPGFRFAANPSTGFYRPGDNQIAAVTGGVMRWLLSSAAMQIDVPITGTAVQSSASDATAGRLLKVGASATTLSASPALRTTYGGTANAITLTTGASLASLPTGFSLRFRASSVNTSAATINVDGIGAIAVKTITGVALPASYIRAATLVARMADASLAEAPVWDDIKTFDGRPWRDRVHLVSAGYPCQPFTLSGLRQGTDDPRHLWPDVARIVGEIAPEWCFFENVPGHPLPGSACLHA